MNDVTALRGDPELAGVVAEAGSYLCLMHMQGEPRTMQAAPRYDDVVAEVAAFLEERLASRSPPASRRSMSASIPGFGFGKTPDQNLELLRGLDALVALGRPVLVGLSRKSTLGRVLGRPEAARSASTPPRSAPPWRRSTAAPRSFASTTSGRTWRRSRLPPSVERGASRDVRSSSAGIELHGFHGVLEEERREGQRFLVDLELEPSTTRAAETDQIEDAVDYRDVVARRAGGLGRSAYHLLEAFAARSRTRSSRASRCARPRPRPQARRRARAAGRARGRRGRAASV